MKFAYFLFVVMSYPMACNDVNTELSMGYLKQGYTPAYDFNAPDEVLKFGKKLKEISGLSFDEKNGTLLCINDEKGKIYSVSPQTGKIVSTADIGKNGDYEGVAMINNLIYVVKSNGKISVYDAEKDIVVGIIDNDLKAKNDIEGLTGDVNGNLLLACKAKGLNTKDHRSNFFYTVDQEKAEGVVEYLRLNVLESLSELTEHGIEDSPYPNIVKSRFTRLYPSGLTFDKDYKRLYVLSSKNHVIAILDAESKKPLAYLALDDKVHKQPEGITFDDSGKLYICNEAAGGTAVINVYYPK